MSKGSGRRPGVGYANNWEAIYGKVPKQDTTASERKETKHTLRSCIHV